jgi:hypothetical protein
MSASPTQHQIVPLEATLDEYLAAQEATWSRPETECRVFEATVVPDRDGVTTGDSVTFRDAEGRYRVLHDGRHRRSRRKLVLG